MSIMWREAMNTGDDGVDDDHRHLVDMINHFELAIANPPINHKKIARILLELLDYTGEHFRREEALQVEIRYPYADSHRRSHRDVLKQLSAIVTDYGHCPLGPERDKMVAGLAGFLREWLVEHIIHSDLRMTPYIQQWQQEKAKVARKQRDAAAVAQRMSQGILHQHP